MLELDVVRAALVRWYRQNQRDLPWRRRSDAYAIWISEVMLQQTRVDTVIPYYERFLERWPDVQALASADPEAVRAAWSGLGYYRRARLMLDAARAVVADHGGALPRELSALRGLPGFGAYTAGAVASIAHGTPTAAVDGNVVRVLARLACIEGDSTKGAPRKQVDELAERLATQPGDGTPGEWTQALMELGATVCTPKSPRCGACPLTTHCRARAHDRIGHIPPARKRPERSTIRLWALVLTTPEHDAVWLAQRPSEGLFALLWTPPLSEAEAPMHTQAHHLGAAGLHAAGVVKHALTHRDLDLEVWAGTLATSTELRRVALTALDEVGLPSIAVKLLRAGLPRATLAPHALPGRRTRRATPQLSLLADSD